MFFKLFVSYMFFLVYWYATAKEKTEAKDIFFKNPVTGIIMVEIQILQEKSS